MTSRELHTSRSGEVMPRKPRHNAPGAVYHLISRFVDREWFITTESERSHYLELLGHALPRTDWRCLSYSIMSNHVHLGLVAGQDPLGSWIRRVHSPFADWMNRSHERIGVMFVRGPKDILVPPERVGRLFAYIHNNPVRAGVVNDPSHSTWTSHRAYVGLARAPAWLHVEEGLQRAGVRDAAQFDEYVRSRPEKPTDDDITSGYEPELDVVATETAASIDPIELVRVAAEVLGLSVEDVHSRRKQHKHVRARRVVARCGDRLGLSGVDIAKALGTSQQCVSKILTTQDDDETDRCVEVRVRQHFQVRAMHGSRK
jgi:REP element-mobilizing transposase RayT